MFLALFARIKKRQAASRSQGRQRKAFMERVFVHVDGLYRYALRLTGDEQRASDLVQESLTKALVAFERLAPDANHRAWLFTIARNTYISGLRRDRHLEELPDAANIPAQGPDTLRLLAGPHDNYRHAFDDEVVGAIQSLSEAQRTAVVLCDVEGLSYEEIDAVMGCPVGTIRSRIHHARKRLREILVDSEHARRMGVRS